MSVASYLMEMITFSSRRILSMDICNIMHIIIIVSVELLTDVTW